MRSLERSGNSEAAGFRLPGTVPCHSLAAVRMQGCRDAGMQGCREPLAAKQRVVVKLESSRTNFPSPACTGRSCKHKSSSRPAKLAEVFLQKDFPCRAIPVVLSGLHDCGRVCSNSCFSATDVWEERHGDRAPQQFCKEQE